MSTTVPYRDVSPLPVPDGERKEGASNDSSEPLRVLVRVLARQAAREVIVSNSAIAATAAKPLPEPESDHDR